MTKWLIDLMLISLGKNAALYLIFYLRKSRFLSWNISLNILRSVVQKNFSKKWSIIKMNIKQKRTGKRVCIRASARVGRPYIWVETEGKACCRRHERFLLLLLRSKFFFKGFCSLPKVLVEIVSLVEEWDATIEYSDQVHLNLVWI